MAIGRSLIESKVEGFVGGVNYTLDFTEVELNQSPNAMNVEFYQGRWGKRRGRERLNTTTAPGGSFGYSVIDFGSTTAGHKQVMHFGTSVYQMTNLSGTLTSIRAGAPAEQSFNARIKSYLIQTYDDYSAPYYWDGSSASMTLMPATTPGFKHVIEFQGYLLGMNISGNTMRVYYEDINTMLSLLQTDGHATYTDFFTVGPAPNDDELTGGFMLNGRCYLHSKYGIFRISFIGGLTVFEYKQVISDVGVVARTVQIVTNSQYGQIAMFLGQDKRVYIFDGSSVKDISTMYYRPNNRTIIALEWLDDTFKDNMCAAVDPITKVYRLYSTRKGDTTNYYSINVDTETFAYYPFDNQAIHSAAVCYDSVGRSALVGLGYNGISYRMGVGNHDDGQAILEYYESPIIRPKDSRMNKTDRAYLTFIPSSNGTLRYEESVDYDKTWKYRNAIPLSHTRDRVLGTNYVLGTTGVLGSDVELLVQPIDVPVTCNAYQFKLRSSAETTPYTVAYGTGTVAGTAGTTSITGTGTTWTSDMTAGDGYKIWIKSGVHKNYVYDFTYVSATSATVSTLTGTAPTDNFTGASYEVFKSKDPAVAPGWILLRAQLDASVFGVGKGEARR